MDQWVSYWLAKQRELGEKGLEIKKFSNGTTYIDLQLTGTKS
jgi:hypothetical protein